MRKKIQNAISILGISTLAMIGIMFAGSVSAAETKTQPANSGTIVDVATQAGSFNTLVAALEATGLDETLSGSGEFTVLAPTDDAFKLLPKGIVQALVGKDTDTLTDILLYHVIEGEVTSDVVVGLSEATTVGGESVDIEVVDGSVYINGAMVTAVDIQASNGVIHVLDAVLVPGSAELPAAKPNKATKRKVKARQAKFNWKNVDGANNYQVRVMNNKGTVVKKMKVKKSKAVVKGLKPDTKYTFQVRAKDNGKYGVWSRATKFKTKAGRADIVATAQAAGSFDTLIAALEATGLDETLMGNGPFTVFAPTDDAFAALPEGTLEALLADPDQLSDILLYHVVSGRVLASDVVQLESAETVQGNSVAITVDNGSVMVDGANVVSTDIKTKNGVIHVIDAVILP